MAAAAARRISLYERFGGIAVAPFGVEAAALIGAKDALVTAMRADKYTDLAAEYGWDIVAGTARFAGGPVHRLGRTRRRPR